MSVTAIVLTGPSGSGKTTVGRALAARLGWTFEDADDHHASDAVGKMTRGVPLTDADRAPWLDRLAALLAQRRADGVPTVLACSALRAAYRHRLAADGVAFVWLRVPEAVLAQRLAARDEHFAGADLLPSQLATAELTEGLVTVDATQAPEQVAWAVARAVGIAE